MMPLNHMNDVLRKTPNGKTNSRLCPFSSEKLRKKINCESIQIRKQKRDNLFNKQRNNLSIERSASPTTNSSNLTASFTDQSELIEALELFALSLQSKYSKYKQSADHIHELINYLGEENRTVLNECVRAYMCLIYENKQLLRFVNGSQTDEDDDAEDANSVSNKRFDDLVENTIKLIGQLVDELTGCCFNTFAPQTLETFTRFVLYLHDQSITTMDQEDRFVFNFIEFCADQQLDDSKIPLYITLFKTIYSMIDGVDDTQRLWIYIRSEQFLDQLKQHTAFAICLLKRNPSETSRPVDQRLVEQYVELQFAFAHLISTELTFDTLNDQDDLYRLISNLKQLVKLNATDRSLIYYVQTMNNFFEPYLDFQLLDFLVPKSDVEQFCSLIKVHFQANDESRIRMTSDTVRLIGTIVRLFSNITSIEMYGKLLVDCSLLSCIPSIFVESKNDLDLIYCILIIIKNIVSIEIYPGDHLETSGKFETTASQCYDQIFSPKFVNEFVSSFDLMNGRCQTETVELLSNLFRNARSNVIRSFVSFKFFRSLHGLLKLNDLNAVYSILEILFTLLQNSHLNSEQLIYLLNYYESSGVLDLVETMSFNKNDKISKLAGALLDHYYNLVELKENISP